MEICYCRLGMSLFFALLTVSFAHAGEICQLETETGGATDRSNTLVGNSFACGKSNNVTGHGNIAFGELNRLERDVQNLGFGALNWVTARQPGAAFGRLNTVSGSHGSAFGQNNNVYADYGSAFGYGNTASGLRSSVFGYNSQAIADDSTAIGANSIADRNNSLSVGAAGAERQIVNVAAGTESNDAVNLAQLRDTLATATAYTDTAVGTGGTATNAYTDNREAAIRDDMQAGDQATLTSAKAYTDSRLGDFSDFRGEVDRRLQHQDARIGRVGALGAAMVGMVASASAVESGRTRIGIAVGAYAGEQAVSIGVQRRLGSRAALTLGGAFSGPERSSTLGVGFGF